MAPSRNTEFGTDRDADLIVVGSGPAGTAAAITARRRGLEVLVLDKATFPRDKTCGDGLTTGALRRLEELGLPLAALPSLAVVREAVLVSPRGRRVSLPFPADGLHAGVVPRLELDASLMALARSMGAEVREASAVARVQQNGTAVSVELEDGSTVRAPWLVAADGHYSTVRRQVDANAKPAIGEWSAFRQYFSGVDDPRLWVLFERDLLPGYAWVFPLPDGRANVGIAVRRRKGGAGKQIAAQWRTLLDRPSVRAVLGPRAEPDGPYRAWPIPSNLDLDALAFGRVLIAGDAAGVVDPLTGEGIAQALTTGIDAVTAITGGGDVGAAYRAAVKRGLDADLRMAATPPPCARARVGRAGRDPGRRRVRLDPPQLRPLDVRGLPARDRDHADALATRRAARCGCLPMMELESVRRLDDLLVRAMPAEETVPFDGWELRATTTAPFRRMNSARAAGPVRDVDAAIAAAEGFYASHNLPARFQVSPASEPTQLDARLEQLGYVIEAATIVATASTSTVAAGPAPSELPHVVLGGAHETWIAQCAAVWGDDAAAGERALAYGRLLRTVETAPKTSVAAALALDPNFGWSGLGFAVAEREHAGIFGMGTRPDVRRRGFGIAVLRALAVWAERHGARNLYLQVEAENDAARTLYRAAGFTDAYGYHYRTKHSIV